MTLRYEHLIGRPYDESKSHDCYEIARDFYRDNFGIQLPALARPHAWWEQGLNLYMDHFAENGFYVLDCPPRDWLPGDGFLMAVKSPIANHSAIYLGENQILHHLYGRFSNVELYSGLWKRFTVAVLRHKDVKITEVERPQLNLLDVLPEPMRSRFQEAQAAHPSTQDGYAPGSPG